MAEAWQGYIDHIVGDKSVVEKAAIMMKDGSFVHSSPEFQVSFCTAGRRARGARPHGRLLPRHGGALLRALIGARPLPGGGHAPKI